MRRTLALLLACALGLGLLPGCTTASAAKELTAPRLSVNPAGSEAVNEALASFGLELLQTTRTAGWEQALKSSEVRLASKGEAGPASFSTLVSPLSVALALSMAANGADGDTLSQFLEVLGSGTGLNELNAACARLTADYQGLGGSTKCSIANSLWADPQGQISQDFIGRCLGAFDAQLFQAELSGSGIVKDLNAWVSKHTNKMIPKIIDQPFQENTALLLVNALYLKNKWLHPFSPNSTHKQEFTHEDGSQTRMDFLGAHSDTLPYLQGEGAQGVVLPYDDGRLAFFALLPDVNTDTGYLSFGDWLNTLEGTDLSRLVSTREDTLFLGLSLPKFTAEWRGDLTKILPELGLEDPFDINKANFSRMGDLPEGYFISQVIHAAKIEVNEKGTEAAAATVAAASGGGAAPQEGGTLVLDRPFLYGIVDLDTGVPLFLGTYE